MSIDIAIEPPRLPGPAAAAPNQGATFLVAAKEIAARTLKKFVRTPA